MTDARNWVAGVTIAPFIEAGSLNDVLEQTQEILQLILTKKCFSFRFDASKWWPTGGRKVKFATEICHKSSIKSYEKPLLSYEVIFKVTHVLLRILTYYILFPYIYYVLCA